jgi:hypothetical protein
VLIVAPTTKPEIAIVVIRAVNRNNLLVLLIGIKITR